MRDAIRRVRLRRIRIRSLKRRFRSRVNYNLWTAEMNRPWIPNDCELPSMFSVLDLIGDLNQNYFIIHRFRVQKNIVFSIDRLRRRV